MTALGPYSPVVRAGQFVIVSGQLGMVDGSLVDGVAAQTTAVVANLSARLAEEGLGLDAVVKTMCFLTDMGTFAEFNDAYVAAMDGNRPARSTIGVAGLPFGAHVEIEAWAYVGDS
jgi:2-iminobutanoate/2-iminopropanoate deaminase